jgi:hypothetical protein
LSGLLRGKGFAWLRGNDVEVFELQYAGGRALMHACGLWDDPLAPAPVAGVPTAADGAAGFRFGFGKRRQELIFIGTSALDPHALVALLDSCLETDALESEAEDPAADAASAVTARPAGVAADATGTDAGAGDGPAP